MKLAELPSVFVEQGDSTAEGAMIRGQFDRLDGVRDSGWLRIARDAYVWADLTVVDRQACTVVLRSRGSDNVNRLQPGSRYPWFDDYWQTTLVEAIVDESRVWKRFSFLPTDAVHFRPGTGTGWQEVGTDLPEGATPYAIESGGWDHEHCNLCLNHIDKTNFQTSAFMI